jgi:hypothetical protein
MLKSRFGEDFFNQVQGNLEIRVQEQKRTQKFDKRRGPKVDKKPRQ